MQDHWKTHVEDVSQCCSTEFWFLFNAIKELTVQCQDKVLKTVKTLLCDHGMEQNCGGRKWPQSNRGLRARVNREAGNFWDHVLHTKTICLRRFKLPHCESREIHICWPDICVGTTLQYASPCETWATVEAERVTPSHNTWKNIRRGGAVRFSLSPGIPRRAFNRASGVDEFIMGWWQHWVRVAKRNSNMSASHEYQHVLCSGCWPGRVPASIRCSRICQKSWWETVSVGNAPCPSGKSYNCL